MKAILLLFDSLNRHMLSPYGCDWVQTPNFERLANKSVKFTQSYIGSMPCMPARRDLHTGRQHFLHRSWGPLEPFDDSLPELLKQNGIYTHLVSDHYHYWEAGGATYHTKYNSWEFIRGQEGDPWKAELAQQELPEYVDQLQANAARLFRQDWVNRKYMQPEIKHPQSRTFQAGIEFLETNHSQDGWFLQIEAFDPHEPFFVPDAYKELYPHSYEGQPFDWPRPGIVRQDEVQIQHVRNTYAALVSMCDAYLGKILDKMDDYGLWQDTMLILSSDHGYLLGEHNYWGKQPFPLYGEVARTPMFIWDPRVELKGTSCNSLTQWMDLAPTLLSYFDIEIPENMKGKDIRLAYEEEERFKKAILFGYHGGHIYCTDGRYVYMRAPATQDNAPLFNYTLMPCHMQSMFEVDELQGLELAEPFSFTKGCRTMRIPVRGNKAKSPCQSLLFDLQSDPEQLHPIEDCNIESAMERQLVQLMLEHEAPLEQYIRLGLMPVKEGMK